MSNHILIRDPQGNQLTTIKDWSRLEYAHGEGKTGFLYLDFDANSVDKSLFQLDCRLEPWRTVGATAPYLDGETSYFVRLWQTQINSAGQKFFHVEASELNYLADGRIVAYPAADAKADLTDSADDMLKVLMRQNMGASATDATRSLATYLDIQADLSLAPSISQALAWGNLGEAFQKIEAASLETGTYLTHDVVANGSRMEFRTYIGQRGNNHGKASGQTVTISRERQNLEEPTLTEDHTKEITFVYCGGQGTNAARVVKTATNAAAVGLSPFNRRELFIDARYVDGTDSASDPAIQAQADAALMLNRARKTLTGKIIDTDGCMDGIHYRYGDIVYAEFEGQGFDAHYNYLHRTIEGGRETSECQIRAES